MASDIQASNKFIEIDLDRERIRIVLAEAYVSCAEYLGGEMLMTKEQFVASIDPYLDSNRVSIPVPLRLPNRLYPGMFLNVDLRKKSVLAHLPNKKKQATLNYMLKTL